jgi:hypothetical protein
LLNKYLVLSLKLDQEIIEAQQVDLIQGALGGEKKTAVYQKKIV